MPTKSFDPHDPFDLVGTAVPVEEGRDNVEEMARSFIQEYLTMGWGEKVIMMMFRKPRYRGPHKVYRDRGEQYIRDLLSEETEKYQSFVRLILTNSGAEEK